MRLVYNVALVEHFIGVFREILYKATILQQLSREVVFDPRKGGEKVPLLGSFSCR